jgi:hypothetical protein
LDYWLPDEREQAREAFEPALNYQFDAEDEFVNEYFPNIAVPSEERRRQAEVYLNIGKVRRRFPCLRSHENLKITGERGPGQLPQLFLLALGDKGNDMADPYQGDSALHRQFPRCLADSYME